MDIEKLIQKCEKCGWVMPLNRKNTVVCAKCGHINNIRKEGKLRLDDLDSIFKKKG